jgi:acyl-CoA thioester hydrolase
MPDPHPPLPRLADYPHVLAIPTRWADNDVYGHVNNVEYYAYFDTVINRWLIEQGGLDIHRGETIGVCAESHCVYRDGFSFPEVIQAGLRVGRLGRTSARYELGLFHGHGGEPAATGWFVHVFVDRASRRPAAIPAPVRAALERLVHEAQGSGSQQASDA